MMEHKKIVIAEDSAIVQYDITKKLEKLGYNVVGSVMSGEEAIDVSERTLPDLVLMDINLAGSIDGIEATEVISRKIDIPVLYMSAYSDKDTINKAKSTKNYGFLIKPFNDRDLLTTIEIAMERHQYDKKLEDSEKKYRELFEESKDSIFITDKKGKFINCNKAMLDLFDYPMDDMLNMYFVDFFSNSEDKEQILNTIVAEGFVKDYECSFKRNDSSEIICIVTANVQKSGNGKISGYQGILRDITDRKRAEENVNQSFDKLRRSMFGIIQAMALTVESRDPYTAGHQKRVSDLARYIASEMELSKHVIDGIRLAAQIHDLGKISIPAEILSKPGSITATEFSLIKEHPNTGFTILKDIEFPWPIQQIILQHHEKIDGSGYPQGLQRDEILIESRIISVADVVEAMASHRPYRAALGIENAIEEIKNGSGSLYDPDVVECCIRILQRSEIITMLMIN